MAASGAEESSAEAGERIGESDERAGIVMQKRGRKEIRRFVGYLLFEFRVPMLALFRKGSRSFTPVRGQQSSQPDLHVSMIWFRFPQAYVFSGDKTASLPRASKKENGDTRLPLPSMPVGSVDSAGTAGVAQGSGEAALRLHCQRNRSV